MSIAKRFITKLWNASKFSISHLHDIRLNADIALMPADRWIIERCKQTALNARKLLDQYEIGPARHEIDDFFWKDLCDYYIEIVKERLYQPEIHGYKERQSVQYALYYCMLNVLKLYAIYVPHVTEYIYQEFFRQYENSISLHKLRWETEESIDDEIIIFGEKLKSIIAETRKYKSENSLSMKTEIEEVVIVTDNKYMEMFKQTTGDIRACCQAKNIKIIQ